MVTLNLLALREHPSDSYSPRTWHNAGAADVTIAFAACFDTAGERLTRRAAGRRYLHAPLGADAACTAADLAPRLSSFAARSVNIAGNGLHSLATTGWRQAAVDRWVFEVLRRVHAQHPIERVLSGGQTGVDIAGAAAALALGVPAHVTMPRGFRQRAADGSDFTQARCHVEKALLAAAEALQACSAEYDDPQP
jgi:hypothetical protein